MLRDLFTQIAWNKKGLLILDTPEHVDSENIKLKIGFCGSFLYQLFSKRNLNIHKMCLKMATIDRFANSANTPETVLY
jgi:hypothetical protein